MSYPKWKHHAKHGQKLVESHEEFEALGEGWGDESHVWRQHLLEKPELSETKVDEVLSEIEKPKKSPGRPKSQKE
jgi:hypothetical protein